MLRKILIKEGESAPLGQLIAIIGEADEDISSLEAKASTPQPSADKAPTPVAADAAVPTPEAATEAGTKTVTAPPAPTQAPAANQPVSGGANGKQGEVLESAPSGRLVVSPLAARMAAEAGIDLRSLSGSGPGGRIIKRDIETAISAGGDTEKTQPAGTVRPVQPLQKSPVAGSSAFRDEPLSVMRKTIANRLVTSLGPVPHFFLTTEIEMDRAVEMRQSIKRT